MGGTYEGNEEGCNCYEQRSACRHACNCDRTEEGAVCQGARRACGSCYQRSEEDWRICYSRPHPAQAQDKASDEGRQTRGVWQSCDGEGKTSEEDCQSLSSRSLEASHLNNLYPPCACWFTWIADRRASCGAILTVYFCI